LFTETIASQETVQQFATGFFPIRFSSTINPILILNDAPEAENTGAIALSFFPFNWWPSAWHNSQHSEQHCYGFLDRV
jgi:hypothetical protein